MSLNSDKTVDRVVWDEGLSVGILMADRDHQRIMDLINRVLDGMLGGQSEVALSGLLDDLIGFAREHFRREEELMRTHDYPELQSHREMHRFLEKKVSGYKTAFLAGEAEVGLAAELMKDWIVLHIQGVDKRYTRYLNARGVV
ncbi:MAG: hemerythrin family protein [Nitrospirae bacterium]|nr:hemerythrin family protein [Magnetococcales bacterium]